MAEETHESKPLAPITQAVARKLAYLTASIVRLGTPLPSEVPVAPCETCRPPRSFISIAILNSKGGAGKSTAAISLAAAAHAAGERAAIIDCDLQQHTAHDWWSIRGGRPKVVQVGAERISPALAEARRNGFTFIVIDTPGQDTPTATAVVSKSDLVLVPMPPNWADFRATVPLLTRLHRGETPYAVLLTRIHKSRAARNERFRSALEQSARVLHGVFPNRELFSDAAGAGLTVFDFNDGNAKDVAHDVGEVYQELRLLGERLRDG
jgi:chromosome partitioning protein